MIDLIAERLDLQAGQARSASSRSSLLPPAAAFSQNEKDRCRNEFMLKCVASLAVVVAVSQFAGAQGPRLPAKVDLAADFEKFGLPPHRQGDRVTDRSPS
ncbi:MAG TPA: hypothetical protein VGX78_02930 [Pirellulales bacterium]|nr:hypothetical protein [Pirellulales bacterium]